MSRHIELGGLREIESLLLYSLALLLLRPLLWMVTLFWLPPEVIKTNSWTSLERTFGLRVWEDPP